MSNINEIVEKNEENTELVLDKFYAITSKIELRSSMYYIIERYAKFCNLRNKDIDVSERKMVNPTQTLH